MGKLQAKRNPGWISDGMGRNPGELIENFERKPSYPTLYVLLSSLEYKVVAFASFLSIPCPQTPILKETCNYA